MNQADIPPAARCAGCGADLSGLSAASPCPWCHGVARHTVPAGASGDEAPAAGAPPAPPSQTEAVARASTLDGAPKERTRVRWRKGERRWTGRWRLVLHLRDRLRDAAAGDLADVDALDVEAWANGFCLACDHLADWLRGDVRRLPGCTRKQSRKRIARFREKEGALQQCRALAAAHRRYREQKATDGTAVIAVHPDGVGWRATAEIGHGEVARPAVDVLALADRCIDAWRGFFADHGIEEPDRPGAGPPAARST